MERTVPAMSSVPVEASVRPPIPSTTSPSSGNFPHVPCFLTAYCPLPGILKHTLLYLSKDRGRGRERNAVFLREQFSYHTYFSIDRIRKMTLSLLRRRRCGQDATGIDRIDNNMVY